jgi:transposase
MTEEPVPPGYRLRAPRGKPRLGPFVERIEQILAEDESAPRKQRHTATRIFERLRDEFGYTGGKTQVCDYVAKVKARPKEAFVPLVSLPGESEADFGESVVEIAGKRVKAHGFVMVLPFSDVWFCACYPKENSESFEDGHARAFEFFGGVPRRSVYDNAGYSVKRGSGPLKGRERRLTDSFAELQSRYLFEAVFANVCSGNEKGSVERKVATVRSRLFVPVPKADSWEALNRMLLERALAAKQASIKFAEESAHLLPVPDHRPERLVSAKADKLSLVRFENCFYSVPTKFVGATLLIKARPFELEIFAGNEWIASHGRIFENGRYVTQLSHYLDLLMLKPRAARCALPVLQAGLPYEFESYRRRVEDGTGEGDRRFVSILCLACEFGIDHVQEALRVALARGLREPADIRLLVMRQLEAIPPKNLTWESPSGQDGPVVELGSLCEYARLLEVAA